jgi:hypothetical protein
VLGFISDYNSFALDFEDECANNWLVYSSFLVLFYAFVRNWGPFLLIMGFVAGKVRPPLLVRCSYLLVFNSGATDFELTLSFLL